MNEVSTPATEAATVSVSGLKRVFPARSGPLVVLDDLSFELAPGDGLSIVGPSGCGKSTLLHILGTLDRPDEGTVEIGGQNPFQLSDTELSHFRNRNIGFVFQDHYLLPQLNVGENLLVPTLAAGEKASLNSEASIERAKQLLEWVGLQDRVDHFPGELSGGERQRVAFARSLILQPGLLLCDEPTGNLDPETAKSIGDLLIKIQKEQGATLIVVTHSMSLAERFDRRGYMENGRLRIE